MRAIHHIELRLLLTCFYIYLNYQSVINIKQVIFHYPVLTTSFQNSSSYIYIRAIVGGCISIIFRLLLLYTLWYKIADQLIISIIFLTVLLGLRLVFDFHGYYSGYISHSLYYPFQSLQSKSMTEEMIDLGVSLLENSLGLILSIYMLIDIIHQTRSRRTNRESTQRLSLYEWE